MTRWCLQTARQWEPRNERRMRWQLICFHVKVFSTAGPRVRSASILGFTYHADPRLVMALYAKRGIKGKTHYE